MLPVPSSEVVIVPSTNNDNEDDIDDYDAMPFDAEPVPGSDVAKRS